MKKYRFFYHYYRQMKKMSVHFKGKCQVVQNVVCDVPCETKFNKTQPYLVMRGFAKYVRISNDIAYISNQDENFEDAGEMSHLQENNMER